MRYIYKHGNQYWYQRAIPEKLSVLLGKKTLKVSLKTNKISMAIKRAKLQALEHQRMFGDLKNNSKKLTLEILFNLHLGMLEYSLLRFQLRMVSGL